MKSRGTLTSEIHVQFSPWELISCGRVGTKILMSWRRSSWRGRRGRRGIEVSKIDMSLNKNSKGILGNVCILVSFALLDCFSFGFFEIYRKFLQTITFLCVFLTKTLSILPRGLTLSFSLSIKFCPLPICRFSHLHTLTPSDTQRRICPNLLTLISVVRNSHQQFFNFFFHPANFSPAQPEIFSVSHLVQCCFTPKKKHPQEHTFSSVAFRQKTEPQEQKSCPNRFKRHAVSREKEKTCPSAASIQKQTCRRKNIFSMRGKISPSGINDAAPKGRGNSGPVLLFEAKKQTQRKKNKVPTGNPFHHILIYYPPIFFSSNIGKKKILLTYKNQNFCLKTFTFSDLLTHTIFRNSLNIFKVLILSFFWSFTPSQPHKKKKNFFSVFKLLLNFNYSFFLQTLDTTRRNQKESFHQSGTKLIWNHAVH